VNLRARTEPVAPARIDKRFVSRISLVAALGGFLFGLDIVLLSGAILFLKKEFRLNELQEGFTMTSAMLACFFGPSLGGWLSDRLGRRKTLALAGILFGASAVGTALAGSITAFNVYRVVGGFGVGVACVVSPLYIAEIAPASIRGRLVTLNQLAIVVGALSSNVVAYYFSFSEDWRGMFAVQVGPIALFLVGLLFVPESPRWLVQRYRNAEALALLTRIAGESSARVEMAAIRDSMTQETGRFSELFAPGVRVALLIAVALAVFQQYTGVSVLQFYAPRVFQQAGFARASDAIAVTLILNVWNLLCTVTALWLVDLVGRRLLLLQGIFGMAVGHTLMALFFQAGVTGVAVPLIMMLSVAAYITSLAPLAWLIMSEIFPNRIRGRAMAVASTCLWIAAYSANLTFPVLTKSCEDRFGTAAGVFWLFAAVCVLAFFFCWFMVPETKGRTLEEIGSSWTRPSPVTQADQ
jgi:SP family arabinose:H+ symporter-like MFS transporter